MAHLGVPHCPNCLIVSAARTPIPKFQICDFNPFRVRYCIIVAEDRAGEGIEEGPLEGPMELHEQAATVTLWLSIITALFRVAVYYFKSTATWAQVTGILLYSALIGSVAYTGYLGGQLVYRHGAGIELALPDFNTSAEDDD